MLDDTSLLLDTLFGLARISRADWIHRHATIFLESALLDVSIMHRNKCCVTFRYLCVHVDEAARMRSMKPQGLGSHCTGKGTATLIYGFSLTRMLPLLAVRTRYQESFLIMALMAHSRSSSVQTIHLTNTRPRPDS